MRKAMSQKPMLTGKLRAVGYVRVSTDQQAQEGVSLEAQQVRIRAHCVSQEITLVEIITDEGYSAKSLERPGLRKSLRMLTTGQADAIIVVKLDRLTRSVKDLGHLCDSYFREGLPFSLLSVSDSIDTRSAGGKLLLNVLMSVAQWEREAISERTQEAMAELKRRGVSLGAAPYGWRYSPDRDAQGRRSLVKHPDEQRAIVRICELHKCGSMTLDEICRQLESEGVPSRCARWSRYTLYRILERAGHKPPRKSRKAEQAKQAFGLPEPEPIRDKHIAVARAHSLRTEGLSLRQIGARLQQEQILPPRTAQWHAASILDLLRQPVPKADAG